MRARERQPSIDAAPRIFQLLTALVGFVGTGATRFANTNPTYAGDLPTDVIAAAATAPPVIATSSIHDLAFNKRGPDQFRAWLIQRLPKRQLEETKIGLRSNLDPAGARPGGGGVT